MKLHAVKSGASAGPANRTLVFLHGYGADEHDLVPLAAELDRGLAVVSLRGPLSLGGPMRAWYHLQQTAQGFDVDPGQIVQADALVVEAVAELAAERGKLLLAGFSQGGGMATRAALTHPEHLAGVISLSGVEPMRAPLVRAAAPTLRGLPAFVAHGLQDPLLPIASGRAVRATLEDAGLSVTYREYPMGHTIAQQEVEDLRAWLAALPAKTA